MPDPDLLCALDNPEKSIMDHLTTTIATFSKGVVVAQEIATVSGAEGSEGGQRTDMDPKNSLLHTKLGIIQMEEFKQRQVYKVEPVAKGVHPDNHNFSLESKRETEYVSTSSVLGSKSERVTNLARK